MNIHTITDADRVTTINIGETHEGMIAAGKYDWKNDGITPEAFPIEGAGNKFRNRIFHFDRDFISSRDAEAEMRAQEFAPGTHVHGLAFGAIVFYERLKRRIVCLGSSRLVRGGRDVVFLDGYNGKRRLDLGGWDSGWDGSFSFLGVQELPRK